MRRYVVASFLVHGLLFSVLSRPPAHHPQRPIFAETLYEVALVRSLEPNFEPPIPAARAAAPKAPEKKAPTPKVKDTVGAAQPKSKKAPKKPEPPANTASKATTANPAGTAQGTDAPVSLGNVDQKNFTHDYYLENLRMMLARAWEPPSGGTGLLRASLHLVIRRDGTIVKPEVVSDSGWALYDRSAIGAVLTVKKFPPLPESYSGDELGLTVNFQRLGDDAP